MNNTLNLSFDSIMGNFSNSNMVTPLGVPSECYNMESGRIVYNADCMIKNICPQLNSYYVRMGIIILVSYVVISWFSWWFFNHGYKLTPNHKLSFFGNFHVLDTRIYWDTFIRSKLLKFSMGFIAVVVWLNLK